MQAWRRRHFRATGRPAEPQGVPAAKPNHGGGNLEPAAGPRPAGRSTRVGSGPNARQHRKDPPRRVVNVRALLRDREFIKVTAYLLPRHAKLRVLAKMERLRHERTVGPDGARPAVGPPPVLPDMTSGELVREINWRLGTLPPGDTETVARYVRRLTRWRAERRRPAADTAPTARAASPLSRG